MPKLIPFRFLVSVVALGLLVGCAGPPELADLSKGELREVSDRNLCEAYFYGKGKNVKNEIDRRQLIREPRWNQVDSNRVVNGMSECAMLAALGSPASTEARTEKETSKIYRYRRNGTIIRIHIKRNRISNIDETERN